MDQDKLTSYLPLIIAAWDSGIDVILHNAPVLVVGSASNEAPFGITDTVSGMVTESAHYLRFEPDQ